MADQLVPSQFPTSCGPSHSVRLSARDPVTCFVVLIVATTCLNQTLGPYVVQYRIRSDRIEFVILGALSLGHIRLRDITDIRKVPFLEALSFAGLSLQTRPFGPWVVISRNRGLFRRVLITPANPGEFIATVTRNRRSSAPTHILARDHSVRNREEILASELCGCFYCTSVFEPSTVVDWAKDEGGDTAICPKCGIDSVLGDRAGYPLSEEFLRRVHEAWF